MKSILNPGLPGSGKPVLLASSSVLLASLAFTSTALADQVIGNGAAFTLGAGDVHDMNCQAFTISNGGKLDTTAGGTLREVTALTIEGELDGGSGSILKLSSWVNNGTVTSAPDTLEFAEDCGPITVAGTSDTDGDGISDDLEGGTDVTDDSQPDLDVDGDGIYNFLDDDSDGDGKPDADEGIGDTDGDGIPNYLDPLDIDASSLIINEIDADTPGTDAAEFIELYDGGVGNTPLDGLVLVLYNGGNDQVSMAYDLAGQTTGADGYFVMCGNDTNVENCDLDVSPGTNLIQNGPDAIALYMGSAADFPSGAAITMDNLVDAIVYDTADADDEGLLALLNAGQPQVDENEAGNKDTYSIQLCPSGTKNQRDTDAYTTMPPTPGAENICSTEADLSLSAVSDKVNPAPGDTVSFTITLNNAGPATANNMMVAIPLADGLVYASDDGAGSYDSVTGIWTVAGLEKDESNVLTLTATVQATGSYVFSAEVTASDQGDVNSDPTVSFDVDDLADGVADNDEVSFSLLDTDGDGFTNDVDADDDGDGILDAGEGADDTDNDGVIDSLDRDSDNDGIPDLNENVCGWSEGRWVLGEADVERRSREASYIHPDGTIVAILGDAMPTGSFTNDPLKNPYEFLDLFGASDPTIEGRSILGTRSIGAAAVNGTKFTLDLSGITITPELVVGFDNFEMGTVSNPIRFRLEMLDADGNSMDLSTLTLVGSEYAVQSGGNSNGPFDEAIALDVATGDFIFTPVGTNSNNSMAAFWSGLPTSAHTLKVSILDSIAAFGSSIRIYTGTPGDLVGCTADPDGDNLPNYKDTDSDGDGIDDNVEAQTTADFTAPGADADGDGLIDVYTEKDDDGNWVSFGLDPNLVNTDGDLEPDYLDPDSDGDGVLDIDETDVDVDTDELPNYRDLDADGDGIPDNVEGQTTGGFTVPLGADDDNDGIDDAYGNGLNPADTDVDGTPDFLDTDSDNSGGDDTTEVGLTLDNADADGDGLDDAIDSDDAAFGPVSADVTDPTVDYTLSSGEPAWRKGNAPPAFMTAETYHIESGRDFGRMLFKLNPLTGEKTEIGSVPYSTTGMAYDAVSGTLYVLSNNGEIAAWDTAAAYAWTVIGSTEDAGWTDPLPANVSYQTGSFYNGSLYFVPTYTPGSDPANMANDLFRIDFSDPVTPTDVVKVADMSGGTVTWNNNDDMTIDTEAGIVYGRSDTNDRDNNQRTSYLYSYDINSGVFAVIKEVTIPYDYSDPPAASVKNDFSGMSIAMEVFDGELWGAGGDGTIYRADKDTGAVEIITDFVHNDADGGVGGDWAGGAVNKLNADSVGYNENDTSVVIDIVSTDDSDAENSGLTYSLDSGADDAVFTIDPASGEITFTTAPDFEVPADADADNAYEVGVKVCDSLDACSTTTLTVNVLDVDEDRDGDGLLDSVEATLGTDPEDADTDGDGLTDGMEAGGSDNDPATTADNINTNPLDSDSDDDGLSDGAEVSGIDGNSATNTDPNLADTDGDGLQDGTELGIDGPLTGGNSRGSNPVAYTGTDPAKLIIDADTTSTTDPLKADTDGGGMCDGANAVDDDCDGGEDLNNNGRVDEGETDPTAGNAEDEMDSDGDGLTDAEEADLGTDPNLADSDGDGLQDADEIGGADNDPDTTVDNTDPLNPDTDADGVYDGPEVGADPRNPVDTDSDGIPDVLDTDDDNDGLLTKHEVPDVDEDGDPADARDTDGDLKPDYLDADDDGDGKPTVDERADEDGDGEPLEAHDMDGDGIPDYLDDTEVPTVHLSVRGILQGAYDANSGLMRDDLRVDNVLPLAQPYSDDVESFGHSGIEVADPAVLAVEGDDAAVDWVLVELRAAGDMESRIIAQAGLLQRDGDVMDSQTGEAKLAFPNVEPGNYFVTLRHRNHLGVSTNDAVSLSPALTMVDFTLPATSTHGAYARLDGGEVSVLWGGEANLSNSVIGNGPGNDVNIVLGRVLTSVANETVNSNFRLNGYFQTDFNLDGVTLFAGPDNDVNLLMGNILLHPENETFSANFVVPGRVPKLRSPE